MSIDSAKAQAIRKLMELSGRARLGEQVLDQVLQALKDSNHYMPEKFWTEVRREMNLEELVEKLVPVYEQHLTVDEVQALLQFYETPAAQRLVEALPAITVASMLIGREWGQSAGERVLKKLRTEGQVSAMRN